MPLAFSEQNSIHGTEQGTNTVVLRDPSSKGAHIDVCLTDAVEYKTKSTGFARFDFVNQALPEVSLDEIDLTTPFLGKTLQAPLMIAPMTGGIERAWHINQRLARAASKFGLAMGVGSQRVAVENADREQFFRIRDEAPDIFLIANLGAVQLAKGWGAQEALRAVKMIDADALYLHFNPIQEAAQGGDLDFRMLGVRVAEVCRALADEGIPVLAREVGFGMSAASAKMLVEAGVAAIDCAGAGGTSWAKVEALCAKSERRRKMGERFAEWGIPTSDALIQVCSVAGNLPVIATGGIRSGLDVAKALALGAHAAAMARPMLVAADQSEEVLHRFIDDVLTELRIAMFGIGAKDVAALRYTPHLVELVSSPWSSSLLAERMRLR